MKYTVVLRPTTLQDTKNIVKWRNMPFVIRNLYSQKKISLNDHISYFQDCIETGKVVQFIISVVNERSVSQDIGTTFLKNIDLDNKKAEFGIFIGEQNALGKGYGKQATSLVLEYAFSNMNLNRVYLSVLSNNIAAINAYKSSGFLIEGELKKDFFINEKYYDVVVMGITKDIWNINN